MTENEIAELFNKARNTINEHIKKIYSNNELEESSTCRNNRQLRFEGRRVEREDFIYVLSKMKYLKWN